MNICVSQSLSGIRHALLDFYGMLWGQFECVFGLYSDVRWRGDEQVIDLSLPERFIHQSQRVVRGKPEPRTWYRVHATAGTSSDCATRALMARHGGKQYSKFVTGRRKSEDEWFYEVNQAFASLFLELILYLGGEPPRYRINVQKNRLLVVHLGSRVSILVAIMRDNEEVSFGRDVRRGRPAYAAVRSARSGP